MKCPRCGAWSDVRATRSILSGFSLRRRRQCANGHLFTTYEIQPAAWSYVRERAAQAAAAAAKRADTWARYLVIVRRLGAGEAPKVIAADLGVSTDLVSKAKAVLRPSSNRF